jgi:hypothetical protein
MTRLTTTLLITAIAGTASASDIYSGFARGNPDLYPHNLSEDSAMVSQRIGVQPGVGDIGVSSRSQGSGSGRYYQSEPYRHYHDWAKGNSDVYPEGVVGMRSAASLSPDTRFTPTVETFGQ